MFRSIKSSLIVCFVLSLLSFQQLRVVAQDQDCQTRNIEFPRIPELAYGLPIDHYRLPYLLTGMTLSPDGEYLAVSNRSEIRIWETDTFELWDTYWLEDVWWVEDIAWSPVHNQIALISFILDEGLPYAAEIIIYDLETFTSASVIQFDLPMRSEEQGLYLNWSPDASYLAVYSEEWVKVIDAISFDTILFDYYYPSEELLALQYATNRFKSSYVTWQTMDDESTANFVYTDRNELVIVNTSTWQEIERFALPTQLIVSVDWSNELSNFVVSYDGRLHVITYPEGYDRRILFHAGHNISRVQWSPDNNYIATGGRSEEQNIVILRNYETDGIIHTFWGREFEWSENSSYLYTLNEAAAFQWDVESGCATTRIILSQE